jgi:hypothetical protein
MENSMKDRIYDMPERDKHIQVCVSEYEKKILQKKAQRMQMSLSAFIRYASWNIPIPKYRIQKDKEVE